MFQTTLWSRIEEAGRGDPGALSAVVERYRQPLVQFVRMQGLSEADAEDLVQEVFLRLFSRDVLARADRARGRFRSYLLGVVRNVIREDAERRSARCRGGGATFVRLSQVGEVGLEASQEEDPAFDQLWSDHILRRALEALRQENPRRHRTLEMRFSEKLSYQEIADRLGHTLQVVKNDIHRARRQLVKVIKEEIGNYSSSDAEYEEELAAFLRFLGER